MALTANYGSKVVESDASITDAWAFHLALVALETSETGLLNPLIHSYSAVHLGGGLYFSAIAFINGWTLQFEAGTYELSGGDYTLTINPVTAAYVQIKQTTATAITAYIDNEPPYTYTISSALAAQPAEVYGNDRQNIEISEALQASPASVSGTGAWYIRGSAALVAQAATVAGTGTHKPLVIVYGSGWMYSSPATIQATTQLEIRFSAAWQAGASSVSSTVYRLITGTGELTTELPSVMGRGYLARDSQTNLQASPALVTVTVEKTIKGYAELTAQPASIKVLRPSEGTGNFIAQPVSITVGITVAYEAIGFEVFSSTDQYNDYILSGGQARQMHGGTGDLVANVSTVEATVYVTPDNSQHELIIGRGELRSNPVQFSGVGYVRDKYALNTGYLESGRSTVNITLHVMDFSEPDNNSIVVLPTNELIVVLPINEIIETYT